MQTKDTHSQLTDLIYDEVALLDAQDYDAWLALLDDDYHWWMPMRHEQTSPLTESSLLYEDLFVTKLRINRLRNVRNFSQQPKSRSQHLLQRPVIVLSELDGELTANSRSQLIYSESRGNNEWHYAACLELSFRYRQSKWLILSRKTTLLNFERPLDSLQLII